MLSSIGDGGISILEKANNFAPRSFIEAPKYFTNWFSFTYGHHETLMIVHGAIVFGAPYSTKL